MLLTILMGAAFLVTLAPTASAATFTVNSTMDDTDADGCEPSPGDCTLREAIEAANATTAKDTIDFDLGSGVPTILVGATTASALPEITKPVIIDGSSGGATRVELDGTNADSLASGLAVSGGHSLVSDMVINDFGQSGIHVFGHGGTRIIGCRIGTDPSGTTAEPNEFGIFISGFALGGPTEGTGDDVVGGTTQSERNLISGNTADGISIAISNGNLIQGNRIGTNAAGTADLPNGGDGILLQDGSSNVIGGTTPGARNLISGNTENGIEISDFAEGTSTSGNVVQGNLIGTNASGMGVVPNGEDGVHFDSYPVNNLVGGTTAAARNVISGNTDDGVGMDLKQFDHHQVIQGNFIGTDITGMGALPNTNGVHINGGRKNLITGNVISGNFSRGITIENTFGSPESARGNVIRGNLIGTNAAGTGAMENTVGIGIDGQPDTLIGGTVPAARNVVSGNTIGIQVGNATGTVIQGNLVGTNAAGASGIPNLEVGISLTGSSQTLVGGTVVGARNVVAFNAGLVSGTDGVVIDGGTGNSLLGNSISANGGLGIDLDDDGVTPNDAGDVDFGTNDLQNFPAVTSARSNGSVTHVKGAVSGRRSTKLVVEFFSNPSCDPSSHGEGRRFLGRRTLPTGPSGTGGFDIVFSVGTTVGHRITATETNTGGSTSEFSLCRKVTAGS
ncbi:MAG: NosD domain-containing protein [Actinomycetota bacterium]